MIRDSAHDLAGWVDDFFSRLSAVDWAFIGLAFLIVVWTWLSLRAATRVGPVTVEALTYDGEDKVPIQALTATLRETLATIGLSMPAAVPGGAPQADLIAAVEASGAPQAAFVAKLLQAIPRPRPPEYTVNGVLAGKEPAPRGCSFAGEPPPAPPTKGPCSLSYWVRPAREGSASLKTVPDQPTHSASVGKAACEIYLHISQDAEGAFPGWARWTDSDAVVAYALGRQLYQKGEETEAVAQLTAAAVKDRLNVLARLELTNLYEASIDGGKTPARAQAQSRVLRRYLDTARQWPSLVEPRYRASIVAAALATTCDPPGGSKDVLTEDQRSKVRETVGLPGSAGAQLSEALRDLAARESKAAVQLLKGWYALLREGRLRTAFEPKGPERRRLLHTVRISEHCVRLRRFTGISPFRRLEIRGRSMLVHGGVVLFGQGEVSWQARYNAACFDSLLLRYLALYANDPKVRVWQDRRRGFILRRALRSLDRAVKDAGRDLSGGWVEKDPDLASLRSAEPDRWKEIVGAPEPGTAGVVLSPPDEDAAFAGLPRAPWPLLRTRATFWGLIALGGLAMVGISGSAWWWVAVAIGAWRARRALWEHGITSRLWRRLRSG